MKNIPANAAAPVAKDRMIGNQSIWPGKPDAQSPPALVSSPTTMEAAQRRGKIPGMADWSMAPNYDRSAAVCKVLFPGDAVGNAPGEAP